MASSYKAAPGAIAQRILKDAAASALSLARGFKFVVVAADAASRESTETDVSDLAQVLALTDRLHRIGLQARVAVRPRFW